ncbi:MAG: signal peptidase [Marmoricola sp.]|nr:signal peptidase [Marmoricola sp.]
MTNVGEAVGSSDRSGDEPVEAPKKKPMPLWQETILLLALALILAIVIKSLFVQAFYIPSPSMEPQFVKNDRILVQKVSYWGSATPSRGDIVVFEDPGNWLDAAESSTPHSPVTRLMEKVGLYPTGGHLVKRVIGTGGDRVVCCDTKGRVTVNGVALNEKSYLPTGTAPSQTKFDVTVPKNHLWMMGDNRGFSYDSRGHMGGPGGGYVDQDLVVGKVFALIWPAKRAEIIHRPKTFEDIPDAR